MEILIALSTLLIATCVWLWWVYHKADADLLDTIPDSALIIDRKGIVVSVNVLLAKWLGRAPENIVRMRVDELMPELHPYINPRPKKPTHQEFQYRGRYFDLVVVRIKHSFAQKYMISFRDMTSRRHAETILQANERRYRALFENSNDAIFIVDTDGKILIANPKAAEMLGLSLEDLLRSNIVRYFAHPSDGAIFQQSVIHSDKLPLYEREFLRVDKQIIQTEVNQTVVRANDGEPLHLQIIVRDVTIRKRAQAELQTRLEQLHLLRQIDDEVNLSLNIDHVGALALDIMARLTLSQAGFMALVNDEEVVVTHTIGLYLQKEVGLPVPLERGVTGRVLVNQEAEMVLDISQDPDYRVDIENTKALMVLPLVSQDRLIGIINLETSKPSRYTADVFQFVQLVASRVAVAIDNARLYDYVVQQLTRIQQLYDEKSHLEQLKTDMIRIASHDLKNPLGIMHGYVTLLQLDRDAFPIQYHSFFDAMSRSAERMGKILEDILSLERIEQRARENATTTFNIRMQLTDILQEYIPQANGKAQAVTLDIDSDAPVMVKGDEAQIYEAITNLISNAIKYTPNGGTISICLNQDEHSVRFEVHDTGYGIPEDRQDRLFQPFYRPKTNETRDIEGTGLGLHLVKNIIERHKGDIIFRSVYGQGSTFGFTLPVEKILALAY